MMDMAELVGATADLRSETSSLPPELKRTVQLSRLKTDSAMRTRLLAQYRAESNQQASRDFSRIHKCAGYGKMQERYEHLKDVDEWFRSLDTDHTGTVDAHELIGPFTVLGMARTRDDVEDLAVQIEEHDADGIKGLSLDEFRAFVRSHGLKPEELRSRASSGLKPGAGRTSAAKRTARQLGELDLRTQITMNRRVQVLAALTAHADGATDAGARRCADLQETLKTLGSHGEWADRATAPLTAAHPADVVAKRSLDAERRYPRELARELARRDRAIATRTVASKPGGAKRTVRTIMGSAPKRAARPQTVGDAYVSKYATSKAAVNVAGKLEKQDGKRLDKTAAIFWGKRAVRAGGTVAVPLYRPGSDFPVLTHVSTIDANVHGNRGKQRRSMRQVLGGTAGVLASQTCV